MRGYWVQHRLIPTLILSVALAVITGYLFIFQYINQLSDAYNNQSVYKNSGIDFIVPEPSEKQISELPGTNGINAVFPYFLTKTQVNINDKSRTSTVLLGDRFQNIEFTMYNSERLIEKASVEYDNPILVDWQFCKDTSAKVGDIVTISIGGNQVEFTVYAIYETNSIYDGGAIVAKISSEQKDAIMQNSKNNGYSGMYVDASDYGACKNYLITEYRPLGRLKNRDAFEDDEQYQIHYDAIMSSGYANEITDFRVRENGLDKDIDSDMVLIASVMVVVCVVGYNIIMAKRGCEGTYFKKYCIPKGKNVKPYYGTSFVMEILLLVAMYSAVIIYNINASDAFIPKSARTIKVVYVPCAAVIAELICYFMNVIMVVCAETKAKSEKKRRNSRETDD